MELSNNALAVLSKRYLKKDEAGNPIEQPEDMFKRVANNISQAEKLYGGDPKEYEEQFYDLMTNLYFLPNSPTLMNAGRDLQQLSACFVLPVEDSMEGIFDSIKNAALIHKSGGGTGFSFSRLRSSGATVKSTGGVASGPISFMKVFNAATEAVKQGGTRRGANMGILRVDHPDILDFIVCKKDTSDITNFNISVAITEKFMDAYKKDEEYDLIDPHTGKAVGSLSARTVFDLIVEMAWTNGEPGIIFIDRMNEDNPTKSVGEIESTNPCGEQPLLPYESCNLGSINLNSMLYKEGNNYILDYDKLRNVVRLSVRFLDDVIDMNQYPLPEIDQMTKSNRKIGLGVMGFADMLMNLKIPYDSQEAVNLAEYIMKFIKDTAMEYSVELGKERGNFPNFEQSTYYGKVESLRNATLTTIAPTGTISIIAGVSSGVEPLFSICFMRNVMDNDKLIEVHPIFERVAKERGIYSEELMQKVAEEGSLRHIANVPEDLKTTFATAHDITPKWHIKMQAAFQKYTDNAVSKTVNFPRTATREDVEEVYLLAYELNCKGVTIYRDGSRENQVLNIMKKEEGQPAEASYGKIIPRERPEVTTGLTERSKMGCGNLYVTVNMDDKGLCEVFTNLGKAGGCPSQSEATSRLISLALRSGIDANSIIGQLKGIRCHSTIRKKGLKVLSCPDAIACTLQKAVDKWEKEYRGEGQESGSRPQAPNVKVTFREEEETDDETVQEDVISCADCEEEVCKGAECGRKNGNACPECGSSLEHEGGCVICYSCGYSKCG